MQSCVSVPSLQGLKQFCLMLRVTVTILVWQHDFYYRGMTLSVVDVALFCDSTEELGRELGNE